MAYRLTDLDLELLGETSLHRSNVNTYNTINRSKGPQVDNTSSTMDVLALIALDSQPTTCSQYNAKPAASLSKKRDASNELGDSDSGSPTKKRYGAKGVPPPTGETPSTEKIVRDRKNRCSLKVPEVKKEPHLQANKSILHEYPTRTRRATRRERDSIQDVVTSDTCKTNDISDTKNNENVSVLVQGHGFHDRSNHHFCQTHKGLHADEGCIDSEVERGATNLWSMLKTADDANSDVEDDTTATTQTSFKNPFDSSQSSLTSNTSLHRSKSSFLSTVLNDLPVEADKAFTPCGPPESAERLSIINDSPGKSDPVPEIQSTPPKRRFRRRQQVIRYDDPDATEDDLQPATTTTPRKLHKSRTSHHHYGPSDNDRTAASSSADPRTPSRSRLCKTTGKPFDRTITVRATPRKRAPPLADFVSDQIAIPTSWADVGDADKQLLQMKEAGNSWEAIRKMWKETTGQEVAPSTLPNRYNRVKANLMVLQDGEHSILLQAVADIEKVQKTEKWARVAALMQSRGAGKYPAEYLQKQFAALS